MTLTSHAHLRNAAVEKPEPVHLFWHEGQGQPRPLPHPLVQVGTESLMGDVILPPYPSSLEGLPEDGRIMFRILCQEAGGGERVVRRREEGMRRSYRRRMLPERHVQPETHFWCCECVGWLTHRAASSLDPH